MAPIPPGPTRPREWRLLRMCLPGAGMVRRTLVLSELGGKYKFGRANRNRRAGSSNNLQFVFDSSFVSREHCSIYCRGGVWHIRDHKSSNGTWLNGVKILEERELRENDRIGLGIDSLTSSNLQHPMEAYHIFTFQQGALDPADVEVQPQPSEVIPKLEHPEVIILDDSDGEESEGSLCSTTITPGPVQEPKEEQGENEYTKKVQKNQEKTVKGNAEATALQKRMEERKLKRNNDEEKRRLAEKAKCVAELKRQEQEEEKQRLAEAAEKNRLADCIPKKRLAAKEETDRIEKKRLVKEETDRVEKQRFAQEEPDTTEKMRLEEELERRRQRELVNAEKRRKSEVARRGAEDRLSTLKREEKRHQKEDARISREQLAELRNSDSTSSSSSSDMEVDIPPPLVDQGTLEMTRKNQAMMTEKVNRSAEKKKTVTASPLKPYKRIRVLTTSSSETEEDLGFLSQAPNPFVASLPSAAPGARPNQALSALALKVEIRNCPVVSLSKRGHVSFSIEKQHWNQLNSETMERVAKQFRRSCTENGVDTALAPKTRKTPDDVQGRVDSIPKKQREEVRSLANPPQAPPSRPAEMDVRQVYITDKTASLLQSPTTPQRQQPPLTPVVASISTRPPIGTNGETLRSQSNIAPVPPPPPPKQNQAQMLVTTVQTMPQQQTSSQALPVAPKPPQRQAKDLNTVIGNLYNRIGKQGSKIKLLPGAVPLPHRQREQQRHEASSRTSMDDETSPPGPSGPGRKEKLRELTSENKTSSVPQRGAAYPAAFVKAKTTNMSRSDRLLDAISAPPVVPLTSSKKPKAAVAPMQPRAESGDPNVVNAIKRNMDKDNIRLSQVANRLPLVDYERPSSSGTNGHQGRGGGLFPTSSTSTSSLPQPSRGGHGGLISGSATVCSATVSYWAKIPISGKPLPTATATSSSSTPNITVERLPEDQVYQDALMWNTQWLQEQESNMKPPPPVNHGQPILTNLPIYKDYESYKNTFYPLMLLELWAAIFQDSTRNDTFGQKSRDVMDSVELAVGIESFAASDSCPLLINPQQNTHRRQKSQNRATQPEGAKFYHTFRLAALVERHGELNRGRDFGTITFDFRLSNGEVQPLTFFAFFQEPQYEEITNMTVIPKSLEKERRSKKFKVTFQMVTHLKYDVTRLIRDNGGRIKKICYISSKIRDFRLLSQLPDSSLFQHILSPPNCTPEQVMSNNGVSRSEFVADVFEKLNPVQRSVVHHISRRVGKGSGPDLMLLHGPPGTGKTRTIVGLIMQLTMDYRCNNPGKQMKILVCTPSNTAVDEIIRRLMPDEDGLKIVRIGSGSTAEDTKKYLLEEVAKPFMSQAGQIDSINQAIRNVDRKIMNAKSEIDDLKADDEKKNSTVISSFEANIMEWQRDRKMYICDLNSVRSDRKGMDQAKRSVILNSQVVFSTLNSCSFGQLRRQSKTGRRDEVVNESPLFTCCIVDEATQTTEPESLSPLIQGCDKLILVGDPKQLPATVLSSEAESKKFRQSLFTRIFNHYEDSCGGEGGANPVMMLTIQYRMHREILKWPNEWFYGKRLVTNSSVDARPPLKIRPYIFLNIASKESNLRNGQISNDEEVKFLKVILNVLSGFSQYPIHRGLSIGIITPYNEQRKKVYQVVNEINKDNLNFGNSIEVDTVDSFQGREKDIILLSCVRTHDLGFVKTPERLNVALTRAKQSLIIVGNAVCLSSNVMWKNLMDDATERGHYTSVNSTDALMGEGFLTDYIRNILVLPIS